jgi:hypothetical protein
MNGGRILGKIPGECTPVPTKTCVWALIVTDEGHRESGGLSGGEFDFMPEAPGRRPVQFDAQRHLPEMIRSDRGHK